MQAFGFGSARGARRRLWGLTAPGNPAALLAPLSFSSSNLTVGTSASGSIVGATTGSTIAATGLPAGLTIAGAARTWAYNGTGPAGSSTITLTETLAGIANSPRMSSVTVTVAAAPGAGWQDSAAWNDDLFWDDAA